MMVEAIGWSMVGISVAVGAAGMVYAALVIQRPKTGRR